VKSFLFVIFWFNIKSAKGGLPAVSQSTSSSKKLYGTQAVFLLPLQAVLLQALNLDSSHPMVGGGEVFTWGLAVEIDILWDTGNPRLRDQGKKGLDQLEALQRDEVNSAICTGSIA
jgi:hypothetical protein